VTDGRQVNVIGKHQDWGGRDVDEVASLACGVSVNDVTTGISVTLIFIYSSSTGNEAMAKKYTNSRHALADRASVWLNAATASAGGSGC
jgi:hypothetical protein